MKSSWRHRGRKQYVIIVTKKTLFVSLGLKKVPVLLGRISHSILKNQDAHNHNSLAAPYFTFTILGSRIDGPSLSEFSSWLSEVPVSIAVSKT